MSGGWLQSRTSLLLDMSSFLKISKYFGIVTVLLCARGQFGQETVTTKSGVVKGIKLKQGDVDIYAYLGIPYAVPPVGEMRFKDSIPVNPWENVHDATKLPPSCMQHPAVPIYEWQPTDVENFDEDCLYLNIWVPVNGKNNDKKAVMLWIHGGGFDTGSTNLDVYDGKALAAWGDLILVTINYRLGAFGFLYSGSDDAPANMGMKDQVLAMRWVKDNIEAFGGDSSLITIFGESVGSISVSTHLTSPLTEGLFSHAILESGTSYQYALSPDLSIGNAMSSKLANVVGCLEENENITNHPAKVVACLRNIDASVIALAERKHLVGPMMTSFIPLHGDDYLPVHPIKDFNAGNIHNVEILVGNVPDEGSFFLGFLDPSLLQEDQPVITKEQAANYIETAFQQVSNPPTSVIIDNYLKNVTQDDSKLLIKRTYDSIGDWLLYCPGVYLSESFSTHKMKAYNYVFHHRRRIAPFKEWLGIPHFEESPFVFGNHLMLNNSFTSEDLEFSSRIMDIWISFAKTGKPVFEGLEAEWPMYSKEKPAAANLNPYNPKIIDPYKEECKFWKQYY